MSIVALFLTLFLLVAHSLSADAAGLSFASCVDQTGCEGERTCKDILTGRPPEDCNLPNVYCVCFPDDFADLFCQVEADCDIGETCVSIPNEIAAVSSTDADGNVCLDNSQIPFFESPTKCSTDEPCPPNTACIDIVEDFSMCASKVSQDTEQVSDPPSFSGDEEADPSPVSVDNLPPDGDEGNGDANDHDDAQPSASAEANEICIAAKSLGHLPQHMLLYERHVLGRVLCDAQGSCATPGHMVHFHGEAMMMKTYCGRVGCEGDVMHVNSPRYRRNLRIPSDTDGLTFSTFAARYGSLAEEKVLRAVFWMGM